MPQYALIGLDIAAILILTFGLYFPRHRRRDLVPAYLCVNIGVLAVVEVLSSAEGVALGLGLGLMGVLSIIRLRSYEISQHEVAYFFAALALGLLAGMNDTTDLLPVGLMALVLVALFVGDHPRLFRRYREQVVVLDRAIIDERELVKELEHLLVARVHSVQVRQVDLVNDTTAVEVRYQLPRSSATDAGAADSRDPAIVSVSR
ncbi:DUF4956 domain-containing protein [Naasia aerilata]|uniref:DUF4956 domain-containing protein n=1 Tax=Naasia aerilata TaxID=1162966 RepID=A0ABM8GGC9_9MICO|nr:DUF4956 domain-containing protein [Naasia aerilata]BDZ47154.1 DUF4956 domain-containing protein [Naasia aerilata]